MTKQIDVSSRRFRGCRRISRFRIYDDSFPEESSVSNIFGKPRTSSHISKDSISTRNHSPSPDMPARRRSSTKPQTLNQVPNDLVKNSFSARVPDLVLIDPHENPFGVSPGTKRSVRKSMSSVSPGKGRTSVSLKKNASFTTESQHPSSPIVKRVRRSHNIEVSLLSQNDRTDWLDPGHSSAAGNPPAILIPSIKTRRPSDSSDDLGVKFCWICHDRRSGQELKPCSDCPRSYHQKCLVTSETEKTNLCWEEGWRCSMCYEVATCDKEDLHKNLTNWQLKTPTEIYEKQIKEIFAFMVDYMSTQNWAEPFRESLDSNERYEIPAIRHPMDLRTLSQRVNDGHCKTLRAFLSDFRWIVLNCILPGKEPNFYLLSKAQLLEQMCLHEVELLRACPNCYLRRINVLGVLPSTSFAFSPISKCDPRIYGRPMRKAAANEPPQSSWFCNTCSVLHPIVWVRYEEGRQWPAKLMAELRNNYLLVTFFGTYVTRKTPVSFVYLHTCLSMSVTTCADESSIGGAGLRRLADSGEYKDDGAYNRAVEQLGCHVDIITHTFCEFQFPSAPASRIVPFSHQSLKKYYGSFNQWVPVGDSLPLPMPSESETQSARNMTAATATKAASLSPGPTGDEVDLTQTNSCLPSSPSLPPSLLSATPPARSPQPSTSSAPAVPTITPASSTTTSDSATSMHNSENSTVLPLTRLSNELSSSLPTLNSGNSRQQPVTVAAASTLNASENGRLEQPPPLDLPRLNLAPGNESRDCDDNAVILVDHPMDETVDSPDTEIFPASDSTSSTLPLRLFENPSHIDIKSSLIAHLQDARDSFSRSFHSILDGLFQNLEDSINDTPVAGSHGASAAVPESDVALHSRPPAPTRDQSSQTSAGVVVSAGFLERNRLEKALLKAEVVRLTQELERARLEKEYTRLEVASSHRDRLAELRAVWEAETRAIVDGVVEICDQDAKKKIQQVKKKQWCTYCGNEAFFYCCWNTVYCNATCQQLHWPEHMTSCTHPKRQVIQQPQTQR